MLLFVLLLLLLVDGLPLSVVISAANLLRMLYVLLHMCVCVFIIFVVRIAIVLIVNVRMFCVAVVVCVDWTSELFGYVCVLLCEQSETTGLLVKGPLCKTGLVPFRGTPAEACAAK